MTDLPGSWVEATVGEVADFIRGVTYQKAQSRDTEQDGFVPLLRATNITEGFLVLDDLTFVPESVVKPSQWLRGGDTLIATSSGSISVVGKSGLATGEQQLTFGAFCGVLRPSERVDPRFLALFVQSPSVRRRWSDAARGTNINNLKADAVMSTPMALPPLDEQQRIVATLEDHLSRLQDAERSLHRVRQLATNAWISFLSRAVEESAEHGTSKALGEVASTRLGKMLDAKRNEGEPTPYLRNQNVQWRSIDFEDVLTVPLSSTEIMDLAVASGDVLVCEGGEPGRCAVVASTPDQPVAFQKALHRIRVSEGVSPDYLQLILEGLSKRGALDSLFTGTTIKHLPQERLRMLEIPIPDERIQHAIVQEALNVRAYLDSLLAQADLSLGKSLGLRRSLLSAAFSGQLTKEPVLV